MANKWGKLSHFTWDSGGLQSGPANESKVGEPTPICMVFDTYIYGIHGG